MKLEIPVLFLVCILYLIALLIESDEINYLVNVLGPTMIVCFSLITIKDFFGYGVKMIWAPIVWFRISFLVYFGIGALVPIFGNDDARNSVFSIYDFSSRTGVKVNLINTLFLEIVMLSFLSMIGLTSSSWSNRKKLDYSKAARDQVSVGWIFLFVGGALRYGIYVPSLFSNSISDLPGFFISLSKIYYAGMFILIISDKERLGVKSIFVIVLVLVDVLVSLASFSKIDTLLGAVFVLVGYNQKFGRFEMKRAAISIAIVGSLYLFLQPLALYGRDYIAMHYGGKAGADLEDRLKIIELYLNNADTANSEKVDTSLSRLSYMATSAYVVDNYDSGHPGETLKHILAAFIPRFLWPDKPIITEHGANLYTEMTGYSSSNYGVGLPAEAYWNLGWLGVAIIGSIVGALFEFLTTLSYNIVEEKKWILFPIVLIGVQIGIRSDGFFIADVLGPVLIILIYLLGFRVLRQYVLSRH